MKETLIFIIICITACSAINDVEIHKTDKTGYCKIGNGYIKEGEWAPAPVGLCQKIKCDKSTPGYEEISALTCPSFIPRRGCVKSGHDLTKPYPACCPRSVCPPGFDKTDLVI